MNTQTIALVLLSLLVLTACGDDGTGTPSTSDAGETMMTAADAGAGNWGAECMTNADCVGPADFCVVNPMAGPPGYCSIVCATNADCGVANMDWTCNAVATCDMPAAVWCGPNSEIAAGAGIIIECE